MSKRNISSGAQVSSGSSPNSGPAPAPIPHAIEVLVKKASVDSEFRTLLFEKRTEAAKAIGLELSAAEAMMLRAVPDKQLDAIINRTSVPRQHRRAFLGTTATAMLAALGAIAGGCRPVTLGSQPGADFSTVDRTHDDPSREYNPRRTREKPEAEPDSPSQSDRTPVTDEDDDYGKIDQ